MHWNLDIHIPAFDRIESSVSKDIKLAISREVELGIAAKQIRL